jgi:hypothetical protein
MSILLNTGNKIGDKGAIKLSEALNINISVDGCNACALLRHYRIAIKTKCSEGCIKFECLSQSHGSSITNTITCIE